MAIYKSFIEVSCKRYFWRRILKYIFVICGVN